MSIIQTVNGVAMVSLHTLPSLQYSLHWLLKTGFIHNVWPNGLYGSPSHSHITKYLFGLHPKSRLGFSFSLFLILSRSLFHQYFVIVHSYELRYGENLWLSSRIEFSLYFWLLVDAWIIQYTYDATAKSSGALHYTEFDFHFFICMCACVCVCAYLSRFDVKSHSFTFANGFLASFGALYSVFYQNHDK